MRCPKCEYVSFEYLDECRKCGVDVVKFKEERGIYMVRPVRFREIGEVETEESLRKVAVAEDIIVEEEKNDIISQEAQEEGEGVVAMNIETFQEIERGDKDIGIKVEDERGDDMIKVEDVPLDISVEDELMESGVSIEIDIGDDDITPEDKTSFT
ncbi:MAG: hypothetical protein HY999_01370 [Nitrospinae bacterium]|nr:hypothetical protein [Nitrospinota bacterium]